MASSRDYVAVRMITRFVQRYRRRPHAINERTVCKVILMRLLMLLQLHSNTLILRGPPHMSFALRTGGGDGQHDRRSVDRSGSVTHPLGPGQGGEEFPDEGLLKETREKQEGTKEGKGGDKKKKKKKKKKSKKYSSSSSSSSTSSSSDSGSLHSPCCTSQLS
jgi:hypothetical protein